MTHVVFFAEGATLAHVARPMLLAREALATGARVSFLRPAEFAWVTRDLDADCHDLACQPPSTFARRLARGQPLFDTATLHRYVDDDLGWLARLKPDRVVGDFRLSLQVSARREGIPYANVTDAYWSPELPFDPPLPVLPFTRLMPIALAAALFRRVAPLAFRQHARPMELVRQAHGLPSLDHDLRRVYADADLRLFPNPEVFYPTLAGVADTAFLGPMAWSPPAPLPDTVADARGHLYVTMGSSGAMPVLKALWPALARCGRRVFVASAGRTLPAACQPNDNIEVFDFLPGDALCRDAALVIGNGGSPITHQALRNGVPVLGIAANMDQFLNMRAVVANGCGALVRADRCGGADFDALIAQWTARRAPVDVLAAHRDAAPVFRHWLAGT